MDKRYRNSLFSGVLLLALCVSCGDDNNDRVNDVIEDEREEVGETFSADLAPVGADGATGRASIRLSLADFDADVDMSNLTPGARTRQYLMAGNKCPTSSMTLDRAVPTTGKILIPLDNDLASQEGGGVYPTPDAAGTYAYERSGNLEDMVRDLRDVDRNSEDNIIKLKPDQILGVKGASVIVTEEREGQELVVSCGILGN